MHTENRERDPEGDVKRAIETHFPWSPRWRWRWRWRWS